MVDFTQMADLTLEQLYRRQHPGVLRIYDISMDEFRDATQGDIDMLMEAATRLSMFRDNARALHDSMQAALEGAYRHRADA